MKKTSLSILSAVSAAALTSCSFGVSDPMTNTETSSGTPVAPAASQDSKTGLDASGNTVPFGASGAVSTQIPNNVILMKKEYEFPGGKATLEGAITLGSDGTIESVQVFNPAGYIEQFSKGVGAVTVGKKIAGLKIDTVSGASLTTAAFNQVLSEHAQ